MKIRWAAPALRDLEEIGDYLARKDRAAAHRIVNAVFAQIENLIDYPLMGRTGRVEGTRELIIVATAFVVPYRVRSDQVEILAVFHGARKWPDSFD